jgi:hypothetical protein
MGMFLCDNCDRLKDSREDGYHCAREKLGSPDFFNCCEHCWPEVMEQVRAGEREYPEIDFHDMKDHFVDEDLEIRKIPQPTD